MKLENVERVQDLLNELRILKSYVSKKEMWRDFGFLNYTHTKVQFPETIGETSLFSYRDDLSIDSRLKQAIDDVELVFMECVRDRIEEIENELEAL